MEKVRKLSTVEHLFLKNFSQNFLKSFTKFQPSRSIYIPKVVQFDNLSIYEDALGRQSHQVQLN